MLKQRKHKQDRRDDEQRRAMQRRHWHVCKLDSTSSCAKIPKEIYDAVNARNIRRLMQSVKHKGQINESNYFAPLKLLMAMEEAHQAVEMRKHDKLGYEILYEKNPCKEQFYAIKLAGQADNTLLDISDYVLLEEPVKKWAVTWRITEFKGDLLMLEAPFNESLLDKKLNVYFISSGISYSACQMALNEFQNDPNKRRFIFEREAVFPLDYELTTTHKIRLDFPACCIADDRLEKLNQEQRQAVIGILEAKCRPKPYILFGPPGTGKTHTLVEAVVQIFLRSQSSRVLFCANSNTCADQTYEKLRQTGEFTYFDLVRLRSGMILETYENVVVTTNIKSSSLAMHGHKFDYVFIDEAGHAHEPESLVPSRFLKNDSCLVLAGDPKQLGPVVLFTPASAYGLESSMLERVILWDIYKRKGASNKYDSRYITKLLTCYRCDPRILTISNKLFYENELSCESATPKSLLKIMHLASPVQVLYCNEGHEYQPPFSHSWKNSAEIEKCADLVIRLYKMGFTPDQLGIMTPYKKQAKEIRKALKSLLRADEPPFLSKMLDNRFAIKVTKTRSVPKDQAALEADLRNAARSRLRAFLKLRQIDEEVDEDEPVEMIDETYSEITETNWLCKIETVDSFQGNEREVIIFSLVRTTTDKKLRFLDDARRFNVAMSRAKMLLIVIGNEQVLKSNNFWNQFLSEAKDDIKQWPRPSMLDEEYSSIHLDRGLIS